MPAESLNDLFIEQVADLYDAEQQLIQALPKMVKAASSKELRKAFEDHLTETEHHVVRLEQVFASIDEKKRREHCPAMEGLLAEGAEIITTHGKGAVKDVALIAAAQRVEHYEMASYGNARAFAEQLGYDEARDLLDTILYEEGEANRTLTRIAQDGLLKEARDA